MNIFKKLTKKKQYTTGVAEQPVMGITTAEYLHIADALDEEYRAACDRQKSCDAKPSGYMKGLKRAIEIVGSFKPHALNSHK